MPAVADLPRPTGWLALAAGFDAFHPHLVWVRGFIVHIALEAIVARVLLALRAIHLRAYRGSVPKGDALLTCGTLPGCTGGQTQRLGKGVGTEEAFGTTRAVTQVAGPSAPSIHSAPAQPLGCAGALFVVRKREAAFAFLARAHGDAAAYKGSTSPGGKDAADLVFQALLVRQALAVGAG
jgi:hypothetical protein